MTRILRARTAGRQPKSVAGKINSTGAPRSGSAKDAEQLRAFAAIRARLQALRSRETIGSKGRL